MTSLEVKDLSVRYGPITALRPLSFSLPQGQVLAVVGPNGAGKSSLLAAVANVISHASGGCALHGVSTRGIRPEQLVRQGLALVPERRRILTNLTVRENLLVGGASFGVSRSGARRTSRALESVLDRFPELVPLLDKPAQTLSGGQQQILAIGRALVSEPSVLLLDEPSLGLAPVIVDRVFDLLSDLRETGAISILLVEQNAMRAIEFADRTMILRSGGLVLEGERSQLLARSALANDFLGHGSSGDGE